MGWTARVAENAWPAETGADNARQLLANVAEVAMQLHDVEQVGGRVNGIRARIAAFDSDAAGLFAELAPDLASWPPQDGVAELQRRLESAIEIRSRREALEDGLITARSELDLATRAAKDAAGELDTLVALAGVAGPEELPDAEHEARALFQPPSGTGSRRVAQPSLGNGSCWASQFGDAAGGRPSRR